MRILISCLLLAATNHCIAQNGWIFDDNPLNDLTSYTTIYPYVGASFIEINGDEFVDLHASPDQLFVNNGDGTFSAITPLDLDFTDATAGSSWADLDNDGDNDVVIAANPSAVFFNHGDGIFSDSSLQVPAFEGYAAWGSAIGNFNNDRHLEFVLAHANGFHPGVDPAPCRFYVEQDALFSPQQITGYRFTDDLFSYTNPYWSDYDLDGDMDLFIASGPATGVPDYDLCYKNLKKETGNDTLVPMMVELFATQKQDGQCYNFIDYDNDGDLDLCLTNYISAQTKFYKNNGGEYSAISTPFSVTTTNIANCWGDYDNDGDLDVIITNNSIKSKYYNNDGDGTFSYLPTGFTTPTATNGIVNADYDNDGDLDVFTNGVGFNGNTSSVGLFINDTVAGDRHWVNLHLTGVASNRSAIGAIVRLRATIYGDPVWQMREVNAQNSFQGQNDLRVHFGLGDAMIIDTIVINWPAGDTEYYYNLPVDEFYTLTEGESNVGVLSQSKEDDHLQLFPNPVHDHMNIAIEPFEPGSIYRITNLMGIEVQSGEITAQHQIIDTHRLASGIYQFSVLSKGSTIVRQFVKTF